MNGYLPSDTGVWQFPMRPDTRTYHLGVVDGDTLDTTLDRGFDTRTDKRLRLYGVDTAEIFGTDRESTEYQRGHAHRQFVRDWIDDRWAVSGTGARARTDSDLSRGVAEWPFTVLALYEPGKYGRPLVDVLDSDGRSLVAALYEAFGAAVSYE